MSARAAPSIRVVADPGGGLRVDGEAQCELGHRLAPSRHGSDGVFASWRFADGRLTVATDRYGFYPLYYAVGANEIVVSPSVAALLERGVSRALDLDALAVFLHVGFFLRDETPFRAIRAVPPGGRVVWTRAGLSAEGAPFSTAAADIDRAAALDAYVATFRQAMGRRPPRGRVAVPLSGGRDSRHILLELVAAGASPDVSVTARFFPPRPDEDAAVAPRIAAALGVPHVLLDQGDEREAESSKNLATGFCADEHAWFRVVGEFLGRAVDTVYDGIGGDVLSAGLFLSPPRVQAYAEGRYDEVATVFMKPRHAATLTRLLAPGVREQLAPARARARVAGELAAHAGAANPIGSFAFWNRTRREIALAPYRMIGGTATVYAPYLDHDLYDLLATLPARMLMDRTFHTDAIRRAFPEHAGLAYERDDAAYGRARPHDRRFLTALLTWGRLRDTGRGVLLAPGLARRLRWAQRADGVRREPMQLAPRLALYLAELEAVAAGGAISGMAVQG